MLEKKRQLNFALYCSYDFELFLRNKVAKINQKRIDEGNLKPLTLSAMLNSAIEQIFRKEYEQFQKQEELAEKTADMKEALSIKNLSNP